MSLSIYFSSSPTALESKENAKAGTLAMAIDCFDGKYFPDLSEADLAIFGVFESRNSLNPSEFNNGSEVVRKHLYNLYPNNYKVKIADFGNILSGETVEDTYFAVSQVVEECAKNNVLPIIVGGSQDLTFANYKAYEKLEQVVNVAAIDSKFDLSDSDEAISDENYLTNIILHKPNFLFNYCNLGHQSYLVNTETENLMKDMYFDVLRLGELQSNITLAEPALRFADMLSVDMGAIRFSENKAVANPSPNGFYGEEICQLMRYAGVSDKMSSIGLYGYRPDLDERESSAKLISQMLWCFIDGYYHRKNEQSFQDKSKYQKFIVPIKEAEYTLSFYKSEQTDRWWIEVPFPSSRNSKYERHQWVPCSYEHYQIACKDEMPDIWWRTYQKLG